MNYNSKANLGIYRQRIVDYRGRMNQILLYYSNYSAVTTVSVLSTVCTVQ